MSKHLKIYMEIIQTIIIMPIQKVISLEIHRVVNQIEVLCHKCNQET
jgi:hypothetical protein